ncbi:Ryanodine receptor Ryr [bacterium]|nr:Ryanodine receptor Ryr [bacterium]
MKINNYKPQPIDVSGIALPTELEPLIEQIAQNVHEVWAETRIRQGWIYGVERNDMLKTHPCIIPYEKLSENEKDYDRNTAINTLKLIVKLGFKIVR